jgi:hypothetical protein
VLINEIRIDQPGGDNDEYFELVGAPGTLLDGLTYIVIGDSTAGGSGNLVGGGFDAIIDLTGQVIPASGYFVVGESTMTIGTPDYIPASPGVNFENSDNVTHMLVTGFTGTSTDDIDLDDDGVIDNVLWATIEDSVALVEAPGNTEHAYGLTVVGPDGSFVPGHVSRIGAGWVINDFGVNYEDTPGRANAYATGTPFCDPASVNSTMGSAVLTGFFGSGVGSDLHLEVVGGPASEIGYFLVGLAAVDPGLMVSNGSLCLGGAFYRYNVFGGPSNSVGAFDAAGVLQNLPGTSTVGTGYDVPNTIPDVVPIPIMAGDVYHFQAWFRDTPAGAGSSNFTNGLTVMF